MIDERKDFFAWSATNNLINLVFYYKDVSATLKERARELEQSDDRVMRANAQKYGEIYPRLFCNSVFLMMYSWLEEHLDHASRTPPFSPPNKGSGIRKYKPLFKTALGEKLGESKDWCFLMDASDVRHCLLHSAGRVDLMRDQDAMRRILKRRASCFEADRKRMHVLPPALSEFHASASRLLDRLIDHFTPLP